jgi:hypothetical protein
MVTTTMRPVKVLREQNKKGVRFSKVDNQDIDFVAEEKKSQRRWSIVKVEKVSQGSDPGSDRGSYRREYLSTS